MRHGLWRKFYPCISRICFWTPSIPADPFASMKQGGNTFSRGLWGYAWGNPPHQARQCKTWEILGATPSSSPGHFSTTPGGPDSLIEVLAGPNQNFLTKNHGNHLEVSKNRRKNSSSVTKSQNVLEAWWGGSDGAGAKLPPHRSANCPSLLQHKGI